MSSFQKLKSESGHFAEMDFFAPTIVLAVTAAILVPYLLRWRDEVRNIRCLETLARVAIDMPMVIFPFDTVVGYGAEHSSLEGLVAAEVQKEGFELTPDPFPEEVYFIRTDQYAFVRQGIPCVYLAEGVGSSNPAVDGLAVINAYMEDHWHQPSDDLSQPIEWKTAMKFARATVRVGYRIALEGERPTWNEGDFFGEKYGTQ